MRNPSFPQPSGAYLLLSFLAITVACLGLALLYLVTTTDPGFIPKGPDAPQLPAASPPAHTAQRYSNYRWVGGSCAGEWGRVEGLE